MCLGLKPRGAAGVRKNCQLHMSFSGIIKTSQMAFKCAVGSVKVRKNGKTRINPHTSGVET